MSTDAFITLLFWLFVAVIVGVCHVWALNQKESRTKQLAVLAKEMGVDFALNVEMDVLSPSGLALFTQDHDKRISNCLKVSVENLESMLFDYEYYWPGNKIILRQSIVCFFLPAAQLPIFQQGYSNEVIQKLFMRKLRNLGKSRSGVKIEISKDYFIYYRLNARVAPEKILSFWEEGVDALNLYLNFASKQLSM